MVSAVLELAGVGINLRRGESSMISLDFTEIKIEQKVKFDKSTLDIKVSNILAV